MADDDYEFEDEKDAEEFDDDDTGATAPATVSDEDRATLGALKASGLSVEDVTGARDRMSAQQERDRAQQATDTRRSEKDANESDPNRVVTAGEAEKIAQRTTDAARQQQVEADRQQAYVDNVLGQIDTVCASDGRLKGNATFIADVKNEVAAVLRDTPNLSTFNGAALEKLIADATVTAVDKRASGAHEMTGTTANTPPAIKRTSAAAAHGQRSQTGRDRKAAPVKHENEAGVMLGIQVDMPNDQEIRNQRDADLQEFWGDPAFEENVIETTNR